MTETERIAALRIIDACANRAAEGMRVVEDWLRFGRDDPFLSAKCKQWRHDLEAALRQAPIDERLAARESQQDAGAEVFASGQNARQSPLDIAHANFSRAQQAVRTLEENLKLFDPSAAVNVQTLRYRLYTLQKSFGASLTGEAWLLDARLYVILSGGPSLAQFETLVESLIAAGVSLIQLRDKQLDDRRLIERARSLSELAHRGGALCIINDRPDIAALAHADGVHIGQDELSVKDARMIVGPKALIGVSTHTIEQARQAVLDGANYVGVGPTFPSGTKSFAEFPGLDLVRAVANEIALPAFAIGGIDEHNLPEVLASGGGRVAVSGAIERADDPVDAMHQLMAILEKPTM